MGLYKKGRNWFIDYRYPPGRAGKRVREKVGPVKDEARILLAQRLKDMRFGRNPELRTVSPIGFKDHAGEVLTQHYSKKRSGPWARLVVECHLIPFFGERFLGEIRPKMVSDYITHRVAAGVANGTVNNERAVLSKLMTLAVEWERIHENPVRKVKKLEQPKGRLRFLSHEEADQFIESAPRHLKSVIITALETGGRLSEILGLRWDDINLGRGLLYFDQTNTKSGKQREIPLTPRVEELLRERSKVQSIGGDPREWVFTRHGKRLTNVRTAFETARKRARLGREVTFHTLRHTFASWYAMRGGDLNLLRELLGHQDLKTTMIYAHLSPTYRRAAVPLMGRQHEAAPRIGGHLVGTFGRFQDQPQDGGSS